MRTLQEAFVTDFKLQVTDAAYKDLCEGEHLQALIAEVAGRKQVCRLLKTSCQAVCMPESACDNLVGDTCCRSGNSNMNRHRIMLIWLLPTMCYSSSATYNKRPSNSKMAILQR